MIARCWLHIGTEKTGTTAIQSHLARNRDALLAQGTLYPDAPSGTNTHFGLTAYALDDHKTDTTRAALGLRSADGVASFRRDYPVALETQIAASGASSIVLSNEHLSARLRTPAEMRRIRELCKRVAADTKIVIYLRNQVDYFVSSYSQYIIDGGTNDFAFDKDPSADYATILDRWSDTFGRENIVVRKFETESFRGDLLSDFAQAVGVDAGRLVAGPSVNLSLDAASIAFLRAFNRRFPSRHSRSVRTTRRILSALLRRRRHGARFLISPMQAAGIEAAFEKSNDTVRSRYFADQEPPLFSPPSLVYRGGEPHESVGGSAATLGMAVALVPLAAGWLIAQMGRR